VTLSVLHVTGGGSDLVLLSPSDDDSSRAGDFLEDSLWAVESFPPY